MAVVEKRERGCETLTLDGRNDPRAVRKVSYLTTSPGYLQTMQIPLLKGRFLNERDTSENPVAVAINQAAAAYYWPGRDPIGTYGHFGGAGGSRFQVVGVMAQIPHDGGIECSLPAGGFLHQRFRFYARPLPLTPGDFETWLRWAAEQKPRHAPGLQMLMKTGARLAVPLRTKKEVTGLLLLREPSKPSEYGDAEKRVLRVWAAQFELLLETSPEMAIGTLAAISVPARSVGGDYYDFFSIGNHRIAIALADVAGKGIAAALVTSIVHASLRIISADGNVSLPELAARMNHYLYRSTRSNSYATFFYAQVDEQNRQLHYVNAGHNPPYLIRRVFATGTHEIAELTTGGTIIGMFPKADYDEGTVDLHPGDVLVAFTDGVPEALNPGEEEFGEDRLKELLGRVAHLPADEMLLRISEEVKSWIRDAPQYDDLTFIVMKVAL
jgi:hypothetical protein